ncbi:hypothetical protein T492DRAFT_980006 [Pavlovales sp. CCMP2436]|nr:hypothetical protein T492DRAFT_980006 [Pavlovales sp. CCMP2436]
MTREEVVSVCAKSGCALRFHVPRRAAQPLGARGRVDPVVQGEVARVSGSELGSRAAGRVRRTGGGSSVAAAMEGARRGSSRVPSAKAGGSSVDDEAELEGRWLTSRTRELQHTEHRSSRTSCPESRGAPAGAAVQSSKGVDFEQRSSCRSSRAELERALRNALSV